jgi:phosphatidylglycerol lysyltransferase
MCGMVWSLRQGWFIEHVVRLPAAPSGTVELLVDAVMRWASEQGSTWLTLGLAPLSGDVPLLLRLARKRMAFLYNFDGLRRFKAKLRPVEWHPIYVSYPPAQGAFLSMVDVLTAFARNLPELGQPWSALEAGVDESPVLAAHAIRHERE